MRPLTWCGVGLAAMGLAAAEPLWVAGLFGAWLLWRSGGRLLYGGVRVAGGVVGGGGGGFRRRGSVASPGDPRPVLPGRRFVRLARDWWFELAVVSSVFWLPGPLAYAVASLVVLGVLGLASRTQRAQRLRERSTVADAALGGAASAADVFERRAVGRCWRRALRACGMPAPRIRLHRERVGWRLEFTAPGAWSAEHYVLAAENLASALHARQVRVERDPANAARGVAWIVVDDVLDAELGPPPWQGEEASLWEPIEIGIDENGEPVTITELPYETMLVGGVKGSGKSAFLHMLIARAAADPNCTLWVADGKGLDFGPWAPRCRRFVKGGDTDAMRDLLADVAAWMEQRRGELEAAGREKALPGDPTGLLIVDEVTVWDMSSRKEPMRENLMHAVQRGRAHGLGTVVATQRPEAGQDGALPSLIRDNLDLKVAFRTSRKGTSDTILGQGSADDGLDSSKLPKLPGVGIADVDGNPRTFRAYRLKPPEPTAEPMPEPMSPNPRAAEPVGSTPQAARMAEQEASEPVGPFTGITEGSPSGSAAGSLPHGHTAGGKRTDVQHLALDAQSLPEPQRRAVEELRRPGHSRMRRVG
jgi:hypothetical protein